MRKSRILVGMVCLLFGMLATAADLPLERIKLPPGFAIELWARVDNARQMALGRHDTQGGTLFVGSMRTGKVHAVRFSSDYSVQGVSQIAGGLQLPVGVAYKGRKPLRLRGEPHPALRRYRAVS